MKKFLVFFTFCFLLLSLSGCKNGVSEKSLEKLEVNMTLSEVEKVIGKKYQEMSISADTYYHYYYWYSNCDTMEDAKVLLKSNKSTYYIGVACYSDGDSIIGYAGGVVSSTLALGDIPFYV